MAFDEEALNNALIMAGLGMMGSRGSAWDKLAQAGMFGLQGYNQVLSAREQKKLQDAKLEEERQQAEQRKLAMQKAQMELERQQRLAQILTGAVAPTVQPAGSQRSVVDAPGWQPQVAQAPQGDPREKIVRMLADAGFTKEAEDQLKIMQGLEGKAHGGIEVDKDGKPFYMTDRGPRYTTGGFVPREKLVGVDLGGQVGFRTEYSPNIVGRVDKTMTGAEKDASARGWANVNLAREQFNRGQFVNDFNTPQGAMPGFVTPKGFNPVAGGAPKQERLHDAAAEKLLTLDQMLQTAGTALNEIKTNGGTGPVIGRLPDMMANYWDAKGMKARQFLSDVSTQITLARSGAAVTDNEYKRLAPFLAAPTDTEEVAKSKLENLIAAYGDIRDARAQFYGAQGFKVPPAFMGSGPALPPNMASGKISRPGQPSPAEAEAELLRRGQKP